MGEVHKPSMSVYRLKIEEQQLAALVALQVVSEQRQKAQELAMMSAVADTGEPVNYVGVCLRGCGGR
jgi:hypothetical protein